MSDIYVESNPPPTPSKSSPSPALSKRRVKPSNFGLRNTPNSQAGSKEFSRDEETGRVYGIRRRVKKYIETKLEGATDAKSMDVAKITPADLQKAQEDGSVQQFLRAKLAVLGYDDTRIIHVIGDTLGAEKYVAGKNAEVWKPDHEMRLKGARTLMEMQGYLGAASRKEEPKTVNNQNNFFNKTSLELSGEDLTLFMAARARAARENRDVQEVFEEVKKDRQMKKMRDLPANLKSANDE